MKSIQYLLTALAAFSFVAAQETTPAITSAATTTESATDAAGTGSLPPSPTDSVGCEPHGDHWHCDGPASATGTVTEEHDHEHEDEHTHDHEEEEHSATGVLPPSPTESVGCEPHGDHWHCDGPATATADVTGTEADGAEETGDASASLELQTTNAGATAGVSVNGLLIGGAVMMLGL